MTTFFATLKRIRERLETLAIDRVATIEQMELARVGYDNAMARGDRENIKAHGARIEDCEKHLADVRHEQSKLEEERNAAINEWVEEQATPEELQAVITSWLRRQTA